MGGCDEGAEGGVMGGCSSVTRVHQVVMRMCHNSLKQAKGSISSF